MLPTRPAPIKSRAQSEIARAGLLHWALGAVAELDKATAAMEPDPVHDLRVAIRRCRSMAEGLRTIDPAPGWKQFRALPKPMFSALGELRDTQVLRQWVSSLAAETDPARVSLSAALEVREREQKQAAHDAVKNFSAKRWIKLAKELDQRARKIPPGSRVFQHLALERWTDGCRLHEIALRTQRDTDLHQLRIGIKRFRYTVENFLPALHHRWSKDLKRMQDLLGEVHDLDVLAMELQRTAAGPVAVQPLLARARQERAIMVSEYVARTTGDGSLWDVWRAGLPTGRALSMTADAKLRHWSRVLDRDPAHSQFVARTGVQLWQAIRRALGWRFDRRATVLLRAAALLHSVGENKGRKKGASFRSRMMGKLSVPVGWTEDEMREVRLASQYCRGPMPSAADAELSSLPESQRRQVLRMAAVLRLADALNSGPKRAKIANVVKAHGFVTVLIEDFDPFSDTAIEAAAARHLFEVAESIPIIVRAAAATAPVAKAAHAN